jgi:hypothetical protein
VHIQHTLSLLLDQPGLTTNLGSQLQIQG